MAKRGSTTKYKDILQLGEQLNEQHKQYVDHYVHRAHKELYNLLAKIMRFTQDIIAMKDKESVIATIRKQLKATYAINTTTKTGDVGVILHFVIRGAHRKTIFTYKKVIQQAIDNQVSADNLAEYIEVNGGIEKLRTGEVEAAATVAHTRASKQMAGFGRALLIAAQDEPLATFQIDNRHSSRMHDAESRSGLRYMVCSYNGTYQVLGIVPMYDELEEKILKEIGCATTERRCFMDAQESNQFELVRQDYATANGLDKVMTKRIRAANDDIAKGKTDAA